MLALTQKMKLKMKIEYLTHSSQLVRAAIPAMAFNKLELEISLDMSLCEFVCCCWPFLVVLCPLAVRLSSVRSVGARLDQLHDKHLQKETHIKRCLSPSLSLFLTCLFLFLVFDSFVPFTAVDKDKCLKQMNGYWCERMTDGNQLRN